MAEGAHTPLEKEKTKEDPAKLARLRANNVDSVEAKAYQKRVKTAAKLWTDQNAKAHAFIVKDCIYSVTAMTIVMENPLITACTNCSKDSLAKLT